MSVPDAQGHYHFPGNFEEGDEESEFQLFCYGAQMAHEGEGLFNFFVPMIVVGARFLLFIAVLQWGGGLQLLG